jgi:hypothetical protein
MVLRIAVSLVLIAGIHNCAAQSTGRIAGSVQTTDGTPVPQAVISINIRSGSTPFSTLVPVNRDGAFTATGLPPGTFAVCPQAPGTALLSPCTWGSVEPTVTVAAGQSVTMTPFRLATGVDLFLRVEDPGSVRATLEGKSPGAQVSTGIRTPRGFVVPLLDSRVDASGHDHHLFVPAAIALELRVFSNAFALTDEKGAAVDKTKGLVIPLNIPAGTQQEKHTISIVGRN